MAAVQMEVPRLRTTLSSQGRPAIPGSRAKDRRLSYAIDDRRRLRRYAW